MSPSLRWIAYPLIALSGLAAIGAALAVIVVLLAYPQLPSLDILTDYRPKIPLRVYSADGQLIGEFGEERRSVVPIGQVPESLKHAIIAAEDERFYQHSGIDYVGVARAALSNLTSGGRSQGASTITMQVARNFFLSSERTLRRKVYEALMAFKIENSLTKDQILQLYINQIYLGQRAYGFAAASRAYFGKNLKDISVAEAAMLAGLPKAPSKYNPVVNPKRAALRQAYVLRRMHELGYIDEDTRAQAQQEELQVRRSDGAGTPGQRQQADFVAEMARLIAVERFGEHAYTMGLRVTTTIRRSDQEAAIDAVRKGVFDYDRRHGYRGAEGFVDMKDVGSDDDELLDDLLQDVPDAAGLHAAVVLAASPASLKVYKRGGEVLTLGADAIKFARAMLDDKAPAARKLRRGAIVRVMQDAKLGWVIGQMPEVEAALVSIDSQDGSVRALVGGFDYNRSKFNHVTQGWRQPGSSFKPFIYSAALEKGYGPATVEEDTPLVVPAGETGSQSWQPKNYDGKYDGPISLRTALAKSKNMVSIRVLRAIGTRYAQDYVTRFGFDATRHPPYLTMALGAGSVTPWQMASAYAVFANGGYRVEPYVVKEITDSEGHVLARFTPRKAGDDSLRVIDERNAYLMNSMMQDVVRRGTATRALALNRSDLAGKTGTTNDYLDAWFCGYQPSLVTISWIGFDNPRTLGRGETGGSAALPMWVDYMRQALKNVEEQQLPMPDGLIRIDAGIDAKGQQRTDLMYEEHLPPEPDSLPSEPEGPASEGELPPAPAPAPAPSPAPRQPSPTGHIVPGEARLAPPAAAGAPVATAACRPRGACPRATASLTRQPAG
ncbi:penicillin-binding protein 1A [Methyloversatilis thermotolerans]|uniref:penicillin-binding protein 1A n=1 Tax=Methyloversatilis thermotolerans TaxID=1346290 RepID=UPI00039FE49A|nr:penicillin-binding protein 1A [Methyloversatilis thermotolerans]